MVNHMLIIVDYQNYLIILHTGGCDGSTTNFERPKIIQSF